jgi:hypothetical protein
MPTKDEEERTARIDAILTQMRQIHADAAKLIRDLVEERDRPERLTKRPRRRGPGRTPR